MRIGSIIQYSPFGGGVRTVKITVLDEHNGQPAFSGILLDDEGMPVRDEMSKYNEPVSVWGYRKQVFAVVY